MTRRAPAVRAAGLVVPVLLLVPGCGLLDRAPEPARIVNESDEDVVVHRIEPEDTYLALVEAGGSRAVPLDGPLCPRTRIVVDADLQVTDEEAG